MDMIESMMESASEMPVNLTGPNPASHVTAEYEMVRGMMHDETTRGRLSRAAAKSYRDLEWARDLTRELSKEYAGSAYGGTDGRKDTYLDLMYQTVDAYMLALVAHRPRVSISTADVSLQGFASHFQVAINNLIESIGLEYTLRSWVLDAFFCVGIIKMHMADSGLVEIEPDLWMDPGKPFASNVSIDNFVYDTNATKWEQIKFSADCYRLPFADLQSSVFDQSVVAKLSPTSKSSSGDQGRIENISKGLECDDDEFEPMIDLADFWIPREGIVYTFAIDPTRRFEIKSEPLAAMRWTGPEFGPHKVLGFSDVPENIMPTSPASHLVNLQKLVNNVWRKQARKARNQRDIIGYTPQGAGTAKKVQRAGDGEMVEMQDPKEINVLKLDGVDPGNQLFVNQAVEVHDRMAGNLTNMLGLGAQADTLGQEQLIRGAVSGKQAGMQYRVVDGTARVIKDLAHMLWEDNASTIPGKIPIEGAEGYHADATWSPMDRDGKFFDYNFQIDPFSMTYQSPGQRVAALNQLVSQIYIPLVPMLQQQGGSLNLHALADIHAEMLMLPQLKRVVEFGSGLPPQPPDGEQPMKSPTSSREYVRRNVGGGERDAASESQQSWEAMAGGQ